jgi:hypothetical protein
MYMTSHYEGFIPIVIHHNTLIHRSDTSIVYRSQPYQVASMEAVVEPLIDQCFIKHDGWWTYELCHRLLTPHTAI